MWIDLNFVYQSAQLQSMYVMVKSCLCMQQPMKLRSAINTDKRFTTIAQLLLQAQPFIASRTLFFFSSHYPNTVVHVIETNLA